ncbi:MAG: glutamate-cysteine ligase family protein [Gemmatimonadota bacterium]|jgi:carboxylate-amine ligase
MTSIEPSDGTIPRAQAVDVREAWRGRGVGVELEFFVVDRETLRPRDHLDLLLDGMPPGSVKPEIAREHVEVVTPPVASLGALEDHARILVEAAGTLLADVGAVLLPLALHDGTGFTLTDLPRYRRLIEVFGPPFWENASTILADQVNLGADDEDQAFRIFRAVRAHLPLFMGLSAASPFVKGAANGIASNRMYRYDACTVRHPGLGGVPPDLRSMAEYRGHLERQPVLPHPNMFYRYVRPMPQRGVAAEIRCIDKQPTLGDFLALTALSRAVAAEALAIRTATDAPHPDPGSDRSPPGERLAADFRRARDRGVLDREGWSRRLDALAGHLPLDERSYLEPLRRSLETGPPAVRLAAAAERRGMRSVLRELVEGYLADPLRAVA